METELYTTGTKFSSLYFLVKLMHLKVSNKWITKSFDSLLKLLKDALLEGNKLPLSHYEANNKMTKLGLGYDSTHVCKYDCALFWKEYKEKKNECLVCGLSNLME